MLRVGRNFRRVRRCRKLTLFPKPTVRPGRARLGPLGLGHHRADGARSHRTRALRASRASTFCGSVTGHPALIWTQRGAIVSVAGGVCAFVTLSNREYRTGPPYQRRRRFRRRVASVLAPARARRLESPRSMKRACGGSDMIGRLTVESSNPFRKVRCSSTAGVQRGRRRADRAHAAGGLRHGPARRAADLASLPEHRRRLWRRRSLRFRLQCRVES